MCYGPGGQKGFSKGVPQNQVILSKNQLRISAKLDILGDSESAAARTERVLVRLEECLGAARERASAIEALAKNAQENARVADEIHADAASIRAQLEEQKLLLEALAAKGDGGCCEIS